MADKTWPISIRYYLRSQAALRLEYEAYWDTYGFVLRDGEGEEHHFGFPESTREEAVYTFVASYTDQGRDKVWPGGVHDKLIERGYDLVDPTRGPVLTPVVRIAMEQLADFASRKGFAFDEERGAAVQFFGALALAREPVDPDEVYVWGASNGYQPKDADMLKEYARRSIEGGGTRGVSKRMLRVDRPRAEKMVEAWRKSLAEAAASTDED
jgi:hypothetical protein